MESCTGVNVILSRGESRLLQNAGGEETAHMTLPINLSMMPCMRSFEGQRP